MAELLGTMEESSPNFLDRKPLFPGQCCFPLSPSKTCDKIYDGLPYNNKDQLACIMQVLGSPNAQDISFVTDNQALDYLKLFQDIPKVNLALKFAGAGSDGIDLLKKLLEFNPFFRITIEKAMNHPFFYGLSNDQPPEPIQEILLEFEDKELDEKSLRDYLVNEII